MCDAHMYFFDTGGFLGAAEVSCGYTKVYIFYFWECLQYKFMWATFNSAVHTNIQYNISKGWEWLYDKHKSLN